MPNQDPPNTIPDFQVPDTSDIPPMPPNEVTSEVPHGAPLGGQSATQSGQLINDDPGSAAPTDDTSGMMVSTPPKKKFGGGKIIATILGLLLLVGGIGAGIILTSQNQNIKEKAAGSCIFDHYKDKQVCVEINGKWQRCDTNPTGEEGMSAECTNSDITGTGVDKGCTEDYPNCVSDGKHCIGAKVCTPTDVPQYANCKPDDSCEKEPPDIVAECKNIKAFSTAGVQLDVTALSKLKAGDQVKFCATGETNQNQVPFNAARFTINGTLRPETSTPGNQPNQFCDLFTIPEGVTTFNVTAQVKIGNQWR